MLDATGAMKAVTSQLLCKLNGFEAVVTRVFGEGAEGPSLEHPSRYLLEEQQATWSQDASNLGDGS